MTLLAGPEDEASLVLAEAAGGGAGQVEGRQLRLEGHGRLLSLGLLQQHDPVPAHVGRLEAVLLLAEGGLDLRGLAGAHSALLDVELGEAVWYEVIREPGLLRLLRRRGGRGAGRIPKSGILRLKSPLSVLKLLQVWTFVSYSILQQIPFSSSLKNFS